MTKTLTISPKRAKKRYLYMMMGGSLAYIATVFGVSFALDDGDPVTAINLILALLPGFPIIIMLFAIWRYLKEVDEVGRHYLTQSLMIALFGTLALSGVWGLAELFLENLPRLPVFYIFPIAMGLFGLAGAFGPARGTHCA